MTTKQPQHCYHLHSFPLPANKKTHLASPPPPGKAQWQSRVEISASDTAAQFSLYHILSFIELPLCYALNLAIFQTTYRYPLPDSRSAAPAKDALSGQLIHKTGKFCYKWSLRAAPMLLSSKLLCFIDTWTCFTKSKEKKIIWLKRPVWSSICISFTRLCLLQCSCAETFSPKAFKKSKRVRSTAKT